MSDEELNTKLYEKMFAEQEAYKEKLLCMSPKEVLEHPTCFSVRRRTRWGIPKE